MRDRQPTKVLENGAMRYGVYDETGALLRYEYLALEDAPSDVGTDLSKANLLTDDTETALFGNAADRTINDAFAGLAAKIKLIMDSVASITLELKDGAGNPIQGVLVQGILNADGEAVHSNTSGVASGYIAEGSQTIKVAGYADIVDYTETISVTKGTTIAKAITLSTRNFLKITSSRSVKFSGNVETIDASIAGGGAGAGAGAGVKQASAASGGGGGSGYVSIQVGMDFTPDVSYPVVIGAGGRGAKYTASGAENATAGGNSSFLGVTATGGAPGENALAEMTSATAGAGGTGGCSGASGVASNSSSGTYNGNNGAGGISGFYSSFEDTVTVAGSGASGGVRRKGNAASNGGIGSNGGGSGGNGDSGVNGTDGTDGTGGGGGSGGVIATSSDGVDRGTAGNGGSGCVAIRMHLKSAA